MKDLPHHIKKLNRQVVRSEHREEMEEGSFEGEVLKAPAQEQTPRQKKSRQKQKGCRLLRAKGQNPRIPEQLEKKPLAFEVILLVEYPPQKRRFFPMRLSHYWNLSKKSDSWTFFHFLWASHMQIKERTKPPKNRSFLSKPRTAG